MAKYSNIANVYEEHATKTEGLSVTDGIVANVVLRTPWAQRWTVVDDLLGPTAIPYPDLPGGWTKPYPVNCSIQPDETKYTTDADEQIIIYEDALISVDYSYVALVLGPTGNVRLIESLEPNVEMLEIENKRKLHWATPTTEKAPIPPGGVIQKRQKVPKNFPLHRQIYSLSLVRQISPIFAPLPTSLLTLPGRINDADYTSNFLGLTFPANTLLFQPPTMSRTILGGSGGWALTLKFKYQYQGWNNFYRTGISDGTTTGGFDAIVETVVDGAGNAEQRGLLLYPEADFSEWLW